MIKVIFIDIKNHFHLEENKLHSTFRLKNSRMNKKDQTKQLWQALMKTTQYQLGSNESNKIERKFGEANQMYGFGKCRYIGKHKYLFQVTFLAEVAPSMMGGDPISSTMSDTDCAMRIIFEG